MKISKLVKGKYAVKRSWWSAPKQIVQYNYFYGQHQKVKAYPKKEQLGRSMEGPILQEQLRQQQLLGLKFLNARRP